jgi:hypothetical protein
MPPSWFAEAFSRQYREVRRLSGFMLEDCVPIALFPDKGSKGGFCLVTDKLPC